LWWVWDARDASHPLAGAFTDWGVGGQYLPSCRSWTW
jgi:hypothetical protein